MADLRAKRLGNFSLIDVAISGAVCDQTQVNRGGPVLPQQVNTYLSTSQNGASVSYPSTVYSIWIGTNDVGSDGLYGGKQTAGISIVDTVDCAKNRWFKTLYQSGARNFLFQSMVTLEHAPVYANQTFMFEPVRAGNRIAFQNLQALAPQYPAAHIGYFDSYALFSNIYVQPKLYLNGTLPVNTYSSVVADNVPPGAGRDSYMWCDSLHPSEQVQRQVALEVNEAINGRGIYTTWFS